MSENPKVTQESKLPLTSQNVEAGRVEALRELFPEAWSEGTLDTEKLKALIGQTAPPKSERYGLSWAGKAAAHKAVQSLSTGTLRPAPDESINFEATSNLIIEGDNLEVLKLLQKSYARKVKMIYVDPPYNTGNEFIYPDNFREGLQTYLEYSGQVQNGVRQSTNSETNGRYHSNWLNMMYPRLFLARNLLKDNGVIFVSIDDHEVHNLRLLMNEIFGEENFVAELVWEKTRKNDAKLFSIGHEYIVVFAKSLSFLKEQKTVWREAKPGAKEIMDKCRSLFAQEGTTSSKVEKGLREWYQSLTQTHPSKRLSRYKNIDKYSPKYGPWRDDNISWPGGGGPRYDVIHPVTKQPCAVPEAGWRFPTPESMQKRIDLGLVVFREDHTQPPYRKTHLLPIPEELADEDIEFTEDTEDEENENEPVGVQVMPSYFYRQAQVSVKHLRNLLGGKIFDNPKDHEVIARLVRYCTSVEENDIILDFFAGSGSTAEACLRLNADDGGNRKFILVQLPETTWSVQKNGTYKESPASKAGYKTIAEITMERVRRVILRLNEEKNGSLPLSDTLQDFGFKAFKLDESNFKVWDGDNTPKDADGMAKRLFEFAEHRIAGRSSQDVLFELLLKSGRQLTVPMEERQINGQTVYIIEHGKLLIYLEEPIKEATLDAMIALGPEQVVCLDAAFEGNDQLKNNVVLQMRDAGISFRTA